MSTKVMKYISLFMLAGTVPPQAFGSPIACGQKVEKIEMIPFYLDSNEAIKKIVGNERTINYINKEEKSIWWVTKLGEGRYVITCKKLVIQNGNFTNSPVSAYCSIGLDLDCKKQKKEMAMAKL